MNHDHQQELSEPVDQKVYELPNLIYCMYLI